MRIIDINQIENWNNSIRKFSNYDIYYQPEYTKAFQIHGDGMPVLFYYEGEKMIAANVAMKRDIAKNNYFTGQIPESTLFDITTPYGYGGFFFEGEVNASELKKLASEYQEICRKENIVSEFVRFHPVLNNHSVQTDMYEVNIIGKTVTIQLKSKEHIWQELHSKNRNVIRKAIKSGIQVYWGRNNELFDRFTDMYNSTMDMDNAEDYYYFNNPFYKSVLNDLKYNSTIFYALLDDEIIAMSIILHSNKKLNYHLSASNRNFQRYAPTNLLLYEAACWGYENGFETFHLGGGLGSKEDNLYKFKKAFNKNSDNEFAVGKKIFLEDSYNSLIDIRKQADSSFDEESNYFPTYRA